MAKKKAVFLFGAGSVIDWGAPSTSKLTTLIRNTGFKTSKGLRVTEVIYQKLVSNQKTEEGLSFETIINFIEELYNYCYLKKNNTPPTLNLYYFLNLDDIISELAFFEVISHGDSPSHYTLKILGYENFARDFIPIEVSPEEKYFELLMRDLLEGVIGHVAKYSYYTSGHNVFLNDEKKSLNDSFTHWMRNFYDKGYCLRLYTLNYDRLFKVLLNKDGIEMFEGFDVEHSFVEYSSYLAPRIDKIVSDFHGNTFYNLHGSAYWHVEGLNANQLPGYQFYLTAGPNFHSPTAAIELEKGRRFLINNIITGYQKVQRTSLSPFRQMLSAFDRDCIEADELIIVGYSYGDEHINDIIRNSRKYNSHVNITFISPSFNDEKIMFEFLLHWGIPEGFIYKNEKEDVITSPYFGVNVIMKTFGEYLMSFKSL